MPVTEPIEFSFDAPTWSLGKSMAAHITMGRIGEVYHKDLKDTIYQICGRRDECRGFVTTDVLVKGLSRGAIATRKLKGVNRDKGHGVYTVSSPYGEGKSLRPVRGVID